MKIVNVYIETDSTSPRNIERRYGYVLEYTASGEAKTREGFGKVTGTYHKATLTALIKALERFRESCEIHIHSANQFVLGAMEKNLPQWAVEEWLTVKGQPIANREEWQEIWRLSGKHLLIAEPGRHTYSAWLIAEMAEQKEKEEQAQERLKLS